MKYNVRIDFVIVLLLDSFDVAHMQICQGLNGTMCCFGYEWDQNQSMCIPCKKGYHGKNCDAKCPTPFFGLRCQSLCNCSDEDCDYISGCRQLTEEQPYTFTIGSDYNVKTLELNDYEHSFNDAHLRQFSICRSIKSESELLKIRGGFFSEDDEILNICPKHRYVVGVGWRSSRMGSIGWTCDHQSKSNSKGTITKEQSFFLKKYYDCLIRIGSGVCSNCRKHLVKRMESDKDNTQGENEVDTYPVASAEVLHKGWAVKSKREFK